MKDLDIFLVARFMYAMGVPTLSDAEYDSLRVKLEGEGHKFNPIYEDDPFPLESFRNLGYTEDEIKELIELTSDQSSEYHDMVMEAECLSILSTNSYHEAYSWFIENQGKEIILTPKIDGINTRRGYSKEGNKMEFKVALTRGRASSSMDVSRNLRYISPDLKADDSLKDSLVVHSETFVRARDIEYLCQAYGLKLTIPRGAGMSMMRKDIYRIEDFALLHSPVFRVDYGSTLVEGLEKAKDLGFEVVPYWSFVYEGESFGKFKERLDTLMREIKDVADSLEYPTDGIVAQVNDMIEYASSDTSRGYSSSNLALKIGLWEPGVYESTVRRIEVSQQDERCNCVAIVDPVIAAGGQTLTRVNLFNPDVMISRGILPGVKIRFEYKNETTINLL